LAFFLKIIWLREGLTDWPPCCVGVDVLASEQKISFPGVEIVDGVGNEGRQDRAEESSCAGQTGDQRRPAGLATLVAKVVQIL